MLRTRSPRSSPVRVLDDRDVGAVLAICDREPVTNVFVSARVRTDGLNPSRLGAQVWGHQVGGRLRSLCYAGANLVPVAATPEAVAAFAGRARGQGRRCSSLVGPSPQVDALWRLLRPSWGPAREVRPVQPVLAIAGPPACASDPAVRRVRLDELDVLMPACVAMFTEEVGVSPAAGDGGVAYRSRVAEIVRSGRAFARIERGRVIFKAEVGAVASRVCQVQGVWVHPDFRGRGLAGAGMAAVVREARRGIAPVVSLYVNDFNVPARAAYRRVGFVQVDTFMSVLF